MALQRVAAPASCLAELVLLPPGVLAVKSNLAGELPLHIALASDVLVISECYENLTLHAFAQTLSRGRAEG
jgi:hypothetical protein